MTRALIPTPAPTARERAAATVAAGAVGAFVLLLAALHLVQPGLDPTWRFISEYALGRAGWLMTAAFLALAGGLLAAVLAAARSVRTWPGRIGLALLVVAVVGVLLAAVFPTDPITTPVADQTVAGRLHNLGASLDWSPVGMLLVAWSLGRTERFRARRRALLVAAAVPCLLTVAFSVAAGATGGHFAPGTYAGLVGRLMLVSYLGWFVTLAHALRAPAPAALPEPVAVA